MSDNTTKRSAPQQADDEPTANADRYDRTGWIDRAAWVGASRALMAGALTLLDPRTNTFTQEQVAAAVEEYRTKEVTAS